MSAALALLLFGGEETWLPFPPALQIDDRWSVAISLRYAVNDGSQAADNPAVTGGLGSLTYDQLWDNGWGGRVEGSYRAGDDDDEVAWGGFFSFSGDIFEGHRAGTGGFVFIADDLSLIQTHVGMKVASRGDGLFWEVRGGVGLAYIHQVNATVSTPAGARIAHAGFFTDSWAFATELAARVGYSEDNWSIFAGIGWEWIADPTEGSLGTNPRSMSIFPVELVGISIGF